MSHKSHEQLHTEIDDAKRKIEVNGIYSHFKNPDSRYTVVGFAVSEHEDELCVLYQVVDDPDLVFIRPVASWLEKVEWEGKLVERFKRVS